MNLFAPIAPGIFRANGRDLGEGLDIIYVPREWNIAFLNLVGQCLPGLNAEEIDEYGVTNLAALPDDAFFDILAIFIPSVDAVYFVDGGLADVHAIRVRSALAQRAMNSAHLRRNSRNSTTIGG